MATSFQMVILTGKERLRRAWHRGAGAGDCLGSSKSSIQGRLSGTGQWSKARGSQPASSAAAVCDCDTLQSPRHPASTTTGKVMVLVISLVHRNYRCICYLTCLHYIKMAYQFITCLILALR